jgi:hypothetical protein
MKYLIFLSLAVAGCNSVVIVRRDYVQNVSPSASAAIANWKSGVASGTALGGSNDLSEVVLDSQSETKADVGLPSTIP